MSKFKRIATSQFNIHMRFAAVEERVSFLWKRYLVVEEILIDKKWKFHKNCLVSPTYFFLNIPSLNGVKNIYTRFVTDKF